MSRVVGLFFVIFLNVIDVILASNRCFVGPPGEGGTQGFCPGDQGCAIVRYKGQYGDLHGPRHDRYQCMNDLAKLHPAFALTDCQDRPNFATCYDHHSRDLVSYTARALSIGEQTFGEVLRLHNIDKFCCCKGDLCNHVNSQVMDFFGHNHHHHQQQDPIYTEGDRMGQAVQEDPFVEKRAKNGASFLAVLPSILTILLCLCI